MTKFARRTGLTLVELLVVIGIIALLVAILLPVLNKARQQAYAIRCENNIRQIDLAMLMYSNENKGTLPIPCSDGGLTVGPVTGAPGGHRQLAQSVVRDMDGLHGRFLFAELARGALWPYLGTKDIGIWQRLLSLRSRPAGLYLCQRPPSKQIAELQLRL